jgi:hypothetical protein
MTGKQKENIIEATEMVNLTKECCRKINFLVDIKDIYGDLKISEIIEILEYQASKFNKRFQELIKEN